MLVGKAERIDWAPQEEGRSSDPATQVVKKAGPQSSTYVGSWACVVGSGTCWTNGLTPNLAVW